MTETRKILLSVTQVLVMLFCAGCQGYIFHAPPLNSPHDGRVYIVKPDYEFKALQGALYSAKRCVDSSGILEIYMGTEMTPLCWFYFENGKIKGWGY